MRDDHGARSRRCSSSGARRRGGKGLMRFSSGKTRRKQLLVVDPDAVYRAGLEEALELVLWNPHAHADAESALAWIAEHATHPLDGVWCEGVLGQTPAGRFIERVRAMRPNIPAVIVTATELSPE